MPVSDEIEKSMQRSKYGMKNQKNEYVFPRYQLIQSIHRLKKPRQVKDPKVKHCLPKCLP
jgi:hypothetical protein